MPLPALVAVLLSMRSGSQQVTLDAFFASLLGEPGLVRAVSDRAFAIERNIRFVMRCDNDNDSGWPAVRAFVRSAQAEAAVTLNTPSARDAADWGCARRAPTVRLVHNVAPSDAIRVLATNLGADEAEAAAFGELYHQRWRIEEAFKRLKHLLHLEAVSGLSQQAQIVDVAAKVLADNLGALRAIVASDATGLPQRQRRCNRSYAARLIQRVLPGVLLLVGDVIDTIIRAIDRLPANTQQDHPGRSRPRPLHHLKPHPRLAYKG